MAQRKRSNAEQIGKRITEFRERSGYTQDYFAAALNMSRSALNMKERGERSLLADEAVRMADYLEISVDELLNGIKPEDVSIHNATGLDGSAVEALRSFHDTQDPDLTASLSSALSYKTVLTSLAQYMSSCKMSGRDGGYFCRADFTPEDGMVHSTMSPSLYRTVLGQNLLRTIDMAASGNYEEYSVETDAPEKIEDALKEDKPTD